MKITVRKASAGRPTAKAAQDSTHARDEARCYAPRPLPVNAFEGLFTGGATLH